MYSKLIIGTANLGFKYGYQKKSIDEKEIKKILIFLKKKKILFIETSENYHSAIKILSKQDLSSFKVILKVSLKNENITTFLKRIKKLYKKLNIKKIYGLLIHNFPENLQKIKIKIFISEMKKLDFINKIGISIYDYNDLKKIDNLSWQPEIIQVPANILDRRFVDHQKIYFKILNKTEVHIRSIFLQGTLLNLDKPPLFLKKWKNIFDNLSLYCKENNVSFLDLNLNYIRKVKSKKIVIGINSLSQIKQIVNFKKKDINVNYNFNNKNLLDPRKWKSNNEKF